MFGAWALLLSAIGVEVAATAALPRTQGFRDPLWTALVLGGYAVSIWHAGPRDPPHPGLGHLRRLGRPRHRRHRHGRRSSCSARASTPFKAGALLMIIAGVLVLNLHGAH